MNFRLDPSSGFADSYLDVEFSVTVPKHTKTVLRIRNETSDDQLQILGTSSGYILGGNELVLKNQTGTTGHINIFNQDKMNKKFLAYRSVTLKCIAEFYDNEDKKIGEEEESVIFYNEIHSLDAEIIPFDLIIHNRTVEITKNEALKIDLISDISKKYELCIGSLDDRIRCHIEVSAREGKTTIEIPGEFLYYDLGLHSNKNKKSKFKFFYVKHQGTTMSRMANRRYMPIQNSELTFQVSGGLTPNSQHRNGPVGKLNRDFMISDRYLVMCPVKNSGFSRKNEYGKEKLMDLTMMINEGQHMNALRKQIKQFADDKNSENINKTEKSLQLTNQSTQMRRPRIAATQIQLMQSVSRTYDTISSRKAPSSHPKKVKSFSAEQESGQKDNRGEQKSGGCTPCSRKREKIAREKNA